MNERYAILVLQELVRRRQAHDGLVDRVWAQAHPAQLRFIEHPGRLKAAICSRRAGKSFAAALVLIIRALLFPYTKQLYLALTRDSAKRILWDDVLKTLNRQLKLDAKFNETELSVRFSNGSVIYLLGADAQTQEQEKLLGQKYKTVVIDEAASFRTDLRRLVYKILEPATIDLQGCIILIGTPGDFIGPPGPDRHMFYAVTSGARRGEASTDNEEQSINGAEWVSFKWNTLDNPHMAELWAEQIERKLRTTPHWAETVEYKTEYLGEWAINEKLLVYHFREDRNLIDELPKGSLWRYIIGIDLGFNDATAFHVWAWRPHDNHLYGVETRKYEGWDLDQVNAELEALKKAYPGSRLIVDGAAKQAVEHLRRVYQQPLHAAAKPAKADFIRHMNTDLTTGRLKLLRASCAPLIAEWATLVWDERVRIPVEKEGQPNHASDAALYAWRDSLHFTAHAPPKAKPSIWSEEAVEAFWERASEQDTEEIDDD